MSYDRIGDEALDALQPDAVQAWLQSRGWKDDGAEGPAARGFSKEVGGKRGEVLVATRPTAPDYRKLMSILIDRVAFIERTTPEGLINDLSAAGYDVFRIRALEADDGILPLGKALAVVKQSRAALQAAARAAASRIARKSYHGRQAEAVTKLLEQVRVGQTERGSYVLPLLVPYTFDTSEAHQMMDWFGRRAVRKLATGLEGVDRALGLARGGDPSRPFAEAAAQGVSADLCQSLGELLAKSGDVELSIRWAASQPEQLEIKSFRFSSSSAPMLHRVAEALREQEPPAPEPIFGYITKLDDHTHRATVSGLIDNRWRNIEFDLGEQFRSGASDAFRDRQAVIIEGPIRREGKGLLLSELTSFEVLGDDVAQLLPTLED